MLQRVVRSTPSASRAIWNAMPGAVQRSLSPFIFPVAAGPRTAGKLLVVPETTGHPTYDVLIEEGAVHQGIESFPAVLRERGHRVISIAEGAELLGVARAEKVVDALYVTAPSPKPERERLARKLGFRVVRTDAIGTPAEADAAFPEVTIIVVTHANREACRHCLAGILRNTPFPGLEVLVVDNGSRDGTRAVLESAARDGRIRVLESPENLGFSRGTNWGLREAQGDVVVLLNDDTVVGPGWLSRLVAHLESEAGPALVCPVTNQIGGAARVEAPYETLDAMEAFARERAFDQAGAWRATETVALFCAAAKKGTLETVGLLDERYEVGMFEDDDLSLALRKRGFRLGVADDAFVHHVGQATFGKLSDAEYLAIWEANRRRFEQKWGVRWRPPS
jgi:GT2 family glycosyltransferase